MAWCLFSSLIVSCLHILSSDWLYLHIFSFFWLVFIWLVLTYSLIQLIAAHLFSHLICHHLAHYIIWLVGAHLFSQLIGHHLPILSSDWLVLTYSLIWLVMTMRIVITQPPPPLASVSTVSWQFGMNTLPINTQQAWTTCGGYTCVLN